MDFEVFAEKYRFTVRLIPETFTEKKFIHLLTDYHGTYEVKISEKAAYLDTAERINYMDIIIKNNTGGEE